MSASETALPVPRSWMSEAHESGWHVVAASANGGLPVAACGYRLAGPVHRRLGPTPPEDAARRICPPCADQAGVPPPRSSERIDWPTVDPDIPWPRTDPDSAEPPTRRRPSLNAALALLPSPDTPNADGGTVPTTDAHESMPVAFALAT
ncbi:hypothetical protein [Haloactinomyces albus]|uniref:Uncharacterized protein n=1 Tax=Haloactinomyces albus TaxID=1352928 RepID=A0AAE4CPB2_9ACTN|nr:hypothetical protein [Haloactinomyces albus]MDR7304241.1 hypothetical protein [Haloactinomyces albus]